MYYFFSKNHFSAPFFLRINGMLGILALCCIGCSSHNNNNTSQLPQGGDSPNAVTSNSTSEPGASTQSQETKDTIVETKTQAETKSNTGTNTGTNTSYVKTVQYKVLKWDGGVTINGKPPQVQQYCRVEEVKFTQTSDFVFVEDEKGANFFLMPDNFQEDKGKGQSCNPPDCFPKLVAATQVGSSKRLGNWLRNNTQKAVIPTKDRPKDVTSKSVHPNPEPLENARDNEAQMRELKKAYQSKQLRDQTP